MTLPASEFIRRFLLHVLPSGFVRIRYFGLLSNRSRTAKLRHCRELLGVCAEPPVAPEGFVAVLKRLTGVDLNRCPVCGVGRMVRQQVFTSLREAPLWAVFRRGLVGEVALV